MYPGGIEGNLTPERLQRFFEQDEHTYRIKKYIREQMRLPLHRRICFAIRLFRGSIWSPAAICSSTWSRRRNSVLCA